MKGTEAKEKARKYNKAIQKIEDEISKIWAILDISKNGLTTKPLTVLQIKAHESRLRDLERQKQDYLRSMEALKKEVSHYWGGHNE